MEWYEYHVSFPCVLPLASLRSEERKVPEAICYFGRRENDVIHMRTKFPLHACKFEEWRSIRKCLGLFVVVVVMERMLHTCIPSSISMRGTVSEFEEWRSNSKEKWLRQFAVVVVMVTMQYTCNNRPCDAKRKKMWSSGQLFRACWPSSAKHTATSLSGITSL